MESRVENRPIRVLHMVDPAGTDRVYGKDRSVVHLFDLFRKTSRVEASLLVTNDGAARAQIAELGFATACLPAIFPFHPKHVVLTRRRIVANRIDILHTHGYRSNVIGRLASLGLPVHVVTTYHGWITTKIHHRVYTSLDLALVRRCDRVFVVAESMRSRLRRAGLGNDRIAVCPPVFVPPPMPSEADVDRVARELGRSASVTQLLFCGRLSGEKGLERLLRATADLGVDCPARLWVAGDGPDDEAMRRIAARLGLNDRVRFLGFRIDVLALLRAADLLVLPSYTEACPQIVLEALAMRRPVLGTRVGMMERLVVHGRTGWLLSAEGVGLADALKYLANRRRMLEDMGMAAGQHLGCVLQEDAGDFFERHYGQIVRQPPRRWFS